MLHEVQAKLKSHEGVGRGSIEYGTVHLIVSRTVDSDGLGYVLVRFVSMARDLFRQIAHWSREAEAYFDPAKIRGVRWVCPFTALGGSRVTGRAHRIDMAAVDKTTAHGVVASDGQGR